MNRLRIALTTILFLSIVSAGTNMALAQCTDPSTSTFPSHVTVCPAGDIPITLQVLSSSGVACLNYPVWLHFVGSAASTLNPSPGYSFPIEQSVVASSAGRVTFRPQVGGCATNGSINYEDPLTGTVIGSTQSINSPDMDGDGQVGLSDVARFAAAYGGTYDRCVDFNGDGIIDLADLTVFAGHYGH